jgi:hypothetical protein
VLALRRLGWRRLASQPRPSRLGAGPNPNARGLTAEVCGCPDGTGIPAQLDDFTLRVGIESRSRRRGVVAPARLDPKPKRPRG